MNSPDGFTDDLRVGYLPHLPTANEFYQSARIFCDEPLWRVLELGAQRTPDAPAVTDAGQEGATLTYADLDAAVRSRAAGFVTEGLRPGHRVLLQQNSSVRFTINFLALVRAGAVPVMALPAHRISEIVHLSDGAAVTAYIGDDDRRGHDFPALADELVRRVPGITSVFIDGDSDRHHTPPDADPRTVTLPETVDPDLPAVFLTSGGTTGLPKLIARTHNDYEYNARRSAEIAALTADDVYLVALPGAHNFPLCCPGILGALSVGAHIVFTDNPSPDNAFDIIERYRVTVTALVPALAQVWCAATEWEPADLSSLRLLQVGGAKLAHSDAVALDAALGDVVQQVFGMAEGLICYTRLDDPRDLVHSSQGAPMSDLDEVRVVDDAGHEVPDGTEGELLTRGPYTIRGYFRAPEHNTRSFTPQGFYRSGDRVRRLPSGHLVVTGRIKDTIVRAGENVAADDVEENLLAHPAIRQVAVVGLPDDALGERICAAIVPATDDPIDLAAIRGFLTDRGLATFKLPDTLRTVASLPVTAVGKIDKTALRESLGVG